MFAGITADHLFQFLIGTVKTKPFKSKKHQEEEVSIPHRYCKNTTLWLIGTEGMSSFNSS